MVNVSYLAPIRRAWERMARMLFMPFRIEMWLVLGFAAFLSEWMTGGGMAGGRGGHGINFHGSPRDLEPAIDRVRSFLQDPFWMGLLVWIVLVAAALLILFQWIGSHGKFVFLDGVVRERAAIREPWSRTARLGDSLFFFRILYLLAAGAVVGVVAVLTVGPALRTIFLEHGDAFQLLAPLVGGLLLLAAIAVVFSLGMLMLDAFVVPIMYRHGIGVMAAWGRFLPLLGAHPLAFIVYIVIVAVLGVCVFAAIITLGLATCCMGFLLMAVPYVGQVLLLPVHVMFRGLGPEFLAQFGPDFDVFATPVAAVAPPPPAGPTA